MQQRNNLYALCLIVLNGIYAFSTCVHAQSASNRKRALFDATSDTARLFAPGVVSTGRNERDMCISGDGKDLYFTLQDPATGYSVIMYCIKKKKGWSKPAVAGFSGKYNDLEPFLSPDGEYMYFASDRPLADGSKPGYDIWRCRKNGKNWGPAENLGSEINSPGNEFYPAVNNNGDVYFTAEREGNIGKEDILVCRKTETGFAKSVPLDTNINSNGYEFNAWVAADDSMIIYTAYGRKDDVGRGDLYISKKDSHGNWMPAVHFEKGINSNRLDYCPFLDSEGNLYFTSERRNIPAMHKPFETVKDWDETLSKPGMGHSDIYCVNRYFLRDWMRQHFGEER